MNNHQEIVRLRQEKQWSERKIANHLQIPASTVHYWLSKKEAPEKAARGRPRKTTADTDAHLYQHSLNHPFATAQEVRNQVAPHISAATVRKRLKEKGMQCRVPARKPFLNPGHIQKRFDFARLHSTWDTQQWGNVVFSDEKIFRASSRGPLRVYRPKGSNRFDRRYLASSENAQGKRFTICVWVAFGKKLKEIHWVRQRTLNAEYYITRILPLIRDRLQQHSLIFMQDRSSIHMSRRARDWFDMNNIQTMQDWPPKGPDMNPVENLWAELVRRLKDHPDNKDLLWEMVHKEFEELDDTYFDKLVDSMPKRMSMVQAAEGGWIKY